MFPPVLLLVMLSAAKADPVPEIFKGAALYRTCQAEVRLMTLPSVAKAVRKDLIDGTYCVGFLNGFLGSVKQDEGAICTDGASMGSVVRAYVNYMESNSSLLDQDRRVGVKLALQQAFPCPAGGSTLPDHGPGARSRLL